MSVINKIYNVLTISKYLKVEIYDAKEIVFCLWESEVPITFNTVTGMAHIDIEQLTVGTLDIHCLMELIDVMAIIQDNSKEIKEWIDGESGVVEWKQRN